MNKSYTMQRKVTGVLFVLVFLFVADASAQFPKFGMKAGVNTSYLRGDKEGKLGDKLQTAFQGGYYGAFYVNEVLWFQPELLLFSGRGSRNFQNQESINLELSYIDVSGLLQYWAHDNFFLYGGPQIGFLMTTRLEKKLETENVVYWMNKVDLGGIVGGGFESDGGFRVFLRYNYGLLQINEERFQNQSLRNSVFQAGIGYTFMK